MSIQSNSSYRNYSFIIVDQAHELHVCTSESVSASLTDLMPFVPTSATITSSQVTRASGVTVSVQLNYHIFIQCSRLGAWTTNPISDSVSASVTNTLTPVAHLERNISVSCSHYMLSVLADDQQNQHSGSGFFANAQNVLVTGGTFVSIFPRLCN